MLVRDVMTSPAVTVTPYTTAREAVRLLSEYRITSLPVLDDDGTVIGVVGEADVLGVLPDAPRPGLPVAAQARVGDVMRHPAITADADADAAEAVRIMTTTGVRSLPVVLNDHIVGVVSRSDLIRVLAHTDELIRYEITGRFRAEGADWTVEVTDRVATIRGPVTEEQRRYAERLARSVHGVAGVRLP